MDRTFHPLRQLFAQLGLSTDANGMAQFIDQHSPLAGHIALPDAPFWTSSQADFLRHTWLEDADWANAVEHLNASLRGA